MNKESLEAYQQLLLKWQKQINLISASTIGDFWQRHIEDSLQLAKLIPTETKTIIDLGSGAGLPGIPLAIETSITTYLIESDKRKSIFLAEAVRTLKLDSKVVNERVEKAEVKTEEPVIIVARALADLKDLFELILKFVENNNIQNYKTILLKGKNVSRETSEAEKIYTFDFREENSITEKDSKILVIENIKIKN